MEKKIIKAMYSNIVSKDATRPTLMGVFFDQECCVATDTHLLVVYHHAMPQHAGKILNAGGEVIPGNFPNYKRVFPKKENYKQIRPRIDLSLLQKACAWFTRQPGFCENDIVVIRGKGLFIKNLAALLGVFALTPEIKTAEMLQTPEGNPAVFKSKSISALLMPATVDETKIDAPRANDCPVCLSLENLINQFVFEGWKPKAVEDPMCWL